MVDNEINNYKKALILDFSDNKSISDLDNFASSVKSRFSISDRDIKIFHKEFLKNNMLKLGNIEDRLSSFTVAKLKDILDEVGFKKTGNKSDLVDRLSNYENIESFNIPETYVITEKGKEFINEYYDILLLRQKKYALDISLEEFVNTKNIKNKNASFSDICWQIFQDRHNTHYFNKDWGLLRNNSLQRYYLLKDEDHIDRVVELFVVAIYDLSGMGNNNMVWNFSHELVAPGIVNEIHNLEINWDIFDFSIDEAYRRVFVPFSYYDKNEVYFIIEDLWQKGGTNFNIIPRNEAPDFDWLYEWDFPRNDKESNKYTEEINQNIEEKNPIKYEIEKVGRLNKLNDIWVPISRKERYAATAFIWIIISFISQLFDEESTMQLILGILVILATIYIFTQGTEELLLEDKQRKIDKKNKKKEETIVQDKKPIQKNLKPKCPKCGSEYVSANKKGWSYWLGTIGSQKVYITCLNCGKRWRAGKYKK